MTISDPKFGAQWVTPTGKTYNYDAVECLLWHLEEEPMEGDAYVIAFDQPTTLIPATSATFLVAKDQPSPMGAFLSAYADNATAIAKAESLSGSWHTWDRLQAGIPNPK